MGRTRNTTPAKVMVDIKPGPVSPAQKQAWRRLWQKLIAEAKSDAVK